MKPTGAQIPIVLLTGFLGSGKTTLLSRLLKHPHLSDTAVVVNEIGAVGLDHHLVQGATESVVVLENACVCCTARDDLAGVLSELFWNRLYRKIPHFSRVVIETTGIARPGPIVTAIQSDSLLAERFRLSRVVTTVDGTLALSQFAAQREAIEQVLAADLLLVTKGDLARAVDLTQLDKELAILNPSAPRKRVTHGEFSPEEFFAASDSHATVVDHAFRNAATNLGEAHQGRIHQLTVRINRALARPVLVAEMTAMLRDRRSQLLRAKGIVSLSGEERPVVVQAVGDVLFPLCPAETGSQPAEPGFLTLMGNSPDFAAVEQGLERMCPGGWAPFEGR